MQSTLVPRHLRRELSGLMHQQCWCWGRDIRRPCGNLLLAYGARRVPPPRARRSASSAYHVTRDNAAHIALWGFGVLSIPVAGVPVLLGRYVPFPQVVDSCADIEQVWTPADLSTRRFDDAASAWWTIIDLCRWMASYEGWVLDVAGPEWRESTTHEWEAAVVPGPEMSGRWRALGHAIETAVLAGVRKAI